MKKSIHRFVSLFVMASCILLARVVFGTQYSLESFDATAETRYHAADIIARGQILNVGMVESPKDYYIYRITFSIESSIKGPEEGTVDLYAPLGGVQYCFYPDAEDVLNVPIHLDELAQRLPMEAFILGEYHTAETYSLFQRISREDWDEIVRYSREYTKRREESQEVYLAVQQVIHEYRSGNISLDEASERRRALEQKYSWFGEAMEESRKHSERGKEVIQEYKKIIHSLKNGEIDADEACIRVNELYEQNEEHQYLLENLARQDGIPIRSEETDGGGEGEGEDSL